MSDKRAVYLNLYVENAYELVESMRTFVEQLEEDPSNEDVINDMFRSAHTFKGNSAALGLKKIADLTHKMENVMSKVRSKEMTFTSEMGDLFNECIDLLTDLIEAVKSNNLDSISTEEKVQELIQLSEKPKEETETTGSVELKFELEQNEIEDLSKYENNLFYIELLFDAENPMKSVRASIFLSELKDISEKILLKPTEEDIEADKFDDKILIIFVSDKSEEEINKITSQFTDFKLNKIETLKKENLKEKFAKKPKKLPKVRLQTGDSIRIKSSMLDGLLDAISEMTINLLIMNNEIIKNDYLDLLDKFSEIDKLNIIMQKSIMQARLMPIATVFNKFPRMMKDTAKALNKEIDFTMSGEDTELDKNVIDQIGDILVHLLRNSVDHGVEMPDEREKSGKSRVGKIDLKAYYESSFIIIEITDDGKGINDEIVAKKALEKGVITEEEFNNMTHQQKIELIFAPGFSTAEKVSDVSGRGVGMDAVKSGVEKLRGRLILNSEVGKGSVVKIQLPLTLAIIPGLICKVCNLIFAVSVEEVDDILTVNKSDLILRGNHYYFFYNEDEVKVYNTENYFSHVDLLKKGLVPEKFYLIIYKVTDNYLAFILDDVVDQYDIVIKPLSKFLEKIKGLDGTVILRDGSAAPLINLSKII